MGDAAVQFTVFGSGLNMLPTTSLPTTPLLTTLWSTKDMKNPSDNCSVLDVVEIADVLTLPLTLSTLPSS